MLLFKFHFTVVRCVAHVFPTLSTTRKQRRKTENENENRACAVHSNINGHLIKLPFKSEQKCLVYISYVRISCSRFVWSSTQNKLYMCQNRAPLTINQEQNKHNYFGQKYLVRCIMFGGSVFFQFVQLIRKSLRKYCFGAYCVSIK